VVIDFVVGADAMVWPMVAAGSSNDEIKIARDTAPRWDDEMGEAGVELGQAASHETARGGRR
jgi:hypothetical protein